MDYKDIKRNLEVEYDMPFSVSMSLDDDEPVFIIGPDDKAKELFTVRVSFKNHIRLQMDFIPQKYSVAFIESMGRQPEENRQRFIKYYEFFRSKGAKCKVSANGQRLDMSDTSKWPKDWKDFELKVSKMPVVTDEKIAYTEVANEWGSLMVGMVLSLADIVLLESDEIFNGYQEGDLRKAEENRYERNPLNRKLCLETKGYDCVVCGMNFEKTYGEIGRHFIHVHHIVPISQLGAGYIINPVRDLVPVCPNCHSMLHRKDPPYLPEELATMIAKHS